MKAEVKVSVMDTQEFKAFLARVEAFIQEYAWHTRDCAAIDADGEWRLGSSPACSCGYDAAREALAGDGA